jgi:hypothetical protein
MGAGHAPSQFGSNGSVDCPLKTNPAGLSSCRRPSPRGGGGNPECRVDCSAGVFSGHGSIWYSVAMSARSSASEVGIFLARLPRRQGQIVAALRRLVRQTAPETAETVLWASLSYHRSSFGGRVKGAVCLITPRDDCVHLGFIHGSALADPFCLLRGSGKAKRFVPIESVQDIDRQALSHLVRAAAEFDPRKAT